MVSETRAEQKARTRRAILGGARDEFEAAGYEGASLRAIADRAGVVAGTIVHHFGDKRGLLHAAFHGDLERVLGEALRRRADEPLAERLSQLTRAVFGYYTKRPALAREQLKHSLFAAPPWDARFGDQVEQVHRTVADWVVHAMEQGEVEEFDPSLFGASYLSFFYFALLGWARGSVERPAPMVDALVAHQLAPYLLHGVASPGAAAPAGQEKP